MTAKENAEPEQAPQVGDPVEVREPDEDPIGPHQAPSDD